MATFEDVFIVSQCDWPVSFPGENATRPTPWETVLPLRRPPHWETELFQVSCGLWSNGFCVSVRKDSPSHEGAACHTDCVLAHLRAVLPDRNTSAPPPPLWQDRVSVSPDFFFFPLLKGGYSQWSASPIAQWVKSRPAMQGTQETQVWSLGQEDPLEKEMVTHSNMLAWRIPWTEEHGGLQSLGSQRVRHNWATKPCHHCQWNSHCFSFIH